MSEQVDEVVATWPSEGAQAAHRAFHKAWGGPGKPLNLYVDSPIWERIAEALTPTEPPTPEASAGVGEGVG